MRHTHLDSLRAGLMLLGIVIHAGFVYLSKQTWLAASSVTSPFFDYLVLVIHTFRMPAFFLLSGFLFALVLARTEPTVFFRARARRVLIPLFTAGLASNAAQYSAFVLLGSEAGSAQLNVTTCDSLQRIYSGCWTIHLWFLVHLFYYFVLAMPLVLLLKKLPALTLPSPMSMLWPVTSGVVLLMAQTILSMAYRGTFDLLYYLPLLNPDGRFVTYMPFFLMGLLLAHCKASPATWQRLGPIAILLLPISWIALLWNFKPDQHSVTLFLKDGRIQTWLYYAVAFQTTAALIVLASQLPRPTPQFAAYLADAALTVYLVHHLILFLLAVFFVNTGLPLGVQFLFLVTLTAALSVAFHHYIVVPSAPVRFCFNARSTPAATASAASGTGN